MIQELIKDALELPEKIEEVYRSINETQHSLELLKEELISLEISTDTKFRLECITNGTKITEKIVENHININQEIKDMKMKIIDTQLSINNYKATLEKLRVKKEMIIAISIIYKQ